MRSFQQIKTQTKRLSLLDLPFWKMNWMILKIKNNKKRKEKFFEISHSFSINKNHCTRQNKNNNNNVLVFFLFVRLKLFQMSNQILDSSSISFIQSIYFFREKRIKFKTIFFFFSEKLFLPSLIS